jgi:predicted nucleic acid-binding protein
MKNVTVTLDEETARWAGVDDRLLTEDLREGARYGPVTVVNPFATDPG